MRLDRTVGRPVYALHRWAYLLSDGRVGASSPMGRVLLLTTTGRRTGRRRTKPLLFLRDADSYLVVASNAGRDRHPDWWWNLQSSPDAWVRDRSSGPIAVHARTPTAAEADALWPRLHAMYDGFAHYATLTSRRLPIVVLDPLPCSFAR